MASISHIDVEVRPSRNYQTVGVTARIVFDTPVTPDEARFEADLVYSQLVDFASSKIDSLSEQRGAEVAPAVQQTAAPVSGVNPADAATWPIAYKPNGAGSFRYLPTSVVPRQRLIEMVTEKLPALGIDPEQVVVFDDRTGDRGIEGGGQSYCVGKVKAKSDSPLTAAMQGKQILANVDFEPGGQVKVTLSRDGKTALQAMQIAGQFASLGAVEESAPF
jgi:hypothetical protein